MSRTARGRTEVIAIAGAGRAGAALAAAFRAAHFDNVAIWSRSPRAAASAARAAKARRASSLIDLAAGATVLLIAVHDDAIASLAREIAALCSTDSLPRTVLHVCGSRSARELAPLSEAGSRIGVFHPMVALQGTRSAARIRGAVITISGEGGAVRVARRLARELGAEPVTVLDDQRPLMHLAAVLAAGDTATLLGLSERLMAHAGIGPASSRRIVASLAQSALDAYRARGSANALTGPLPRRDAETLRLHAQATRSLGRKGVLPQRIHDLLLEEGAGQLVRAGRLTRAQATRLLRRMRRE